MTNFSIKSKESTKVRFGE